MKNTDTILGAFAIVGFVLLGVFAFAGNTTDTARLDEDQIDETTEVELVTTEYSEVVELNTEENTETELDNADDQVNRLTADLENSNLINDLDPETIRNGVSSFLQGGDVERRNQVLNGMDMNTETELTTNEEVVEVEVEETIEVEDETELDSDSETDETELVVDETADETVVDEESEGRVSRFFSNLFGRGDNVGGNTETGDDSDESDNTDDEADMDNDEVITGGDYVVAAGDNLWDIMRTELGYTNAQAAQALQNLTSSDYDNLGLTSNNEDLIYVGQTLDLSVLSVG